MLCGYFIIDFRCLLLIKDVVDLCLNHSWSSQESKHLKNNNNFDIIHDQSPLHSGCIEQRIIHAVTHGKRPELDMMGLDVPGEVKSLITQCWAQQPNERPAFIGTL